MAEYGSLLIAIVVSLVLGVVVLGLGELISTKTVTTEKVSIYECGFEAYSDARESFDVQYYVIGMMFIVFDLEASYLIPWGLVVDKLGSSGYWVMMEFLLELCVGYWYAWRIGAIRFGSVDE